MSSWIIFVKCTSHARHGTNHKPPPNEPCYNISNARTAIRDESIRIADGHVGRGGILLVLSASHRATTFVGRFVNDDCRSSHDTSGTVSVFGSHSDILGILILLDSRSDLLLPSALVALDFGHILSSSAIRRLWNLRLVVASFCLTQAGIADTPEGRGRGAMLSRGVHHRSSQPFIRSPRRAATRPDGACPYRRVG